MHRIEETISRGMCIGCGVCSVASNGAIHLELSATRMYQADVSGAPESAVRAGSRVCPFSDESPNEDALDAPCGSAGGAHDPRLGRVTRTLAGRVRDEAYLEGSSSGGLTSWTTRRLIGAGHVDAAISVGRAPENSDALFRYAATGEADVATHRKSHYYAATMADVLTVIADSEKRYVLVGVPCFIRAARALCRERPDLAERLPFFVALVCGHYKTQAFAESLAWQIGVPPDVLGEVDFRVKQTDKGANDYGFAARAHGADPWSSAPVRDLVGGNWGHSAFQPEACNFCDDVVGETADVSFGDAWLPRFSADPRGTNVVVTRNPIVDELLEAGRQCGEIELFDISSDEVVDSQAGGFRHRRQGLALRLADDIEAGLSVPRKRVAPDASVVTPQRAALVRQRRRMATLSHESFSRAKASGDIRVYLRAQHKEMRRYRRIELTRRQRLTEGVKRVLRRTLPASAVSALQRWRDK